MIDRRALWFTTVVALGGVALVLGLLFSPGGGGRAQTSTYGYPAKVVCGLLSYTDPLSGETVDLDLRTAVNIHNPTEAQVIVDKTAVVALPETDTPLPPGDNPATDPIGADGATEVDCLEVLSLLGTSAPKEDGSLSATSCSDGSDNGGVDGLIDLDDPDCFVKGFAVIESPSKIDVVGVYTAQRVLDGTTPGVGHSIEVDTIQARSLPPDEPLPGEAVTYPVKFACGNPLAADPLVSGVYFTAVNVHNPNLTTVNLGKKVVLALPEGDTPIGPTQFFPFSLGPNRAFEVDCADIVSLLAAAGITPPGPFIKGFVVLAAPAELDVVGVYISTEEATIPPDGGVGLSLDIEPVTKELGAAPPKTTLTNFSCEHTSSVVAGNTNVHVGCVLNSPPPQAIFDWEVIYADQSPVMNGPANPLNPSDCSEGLGPPVPTNWVPDNSLIGTRVKCEDPTHGSNPWVVGECRDIHFTLTGAQGPWTTLKLHATDADQQNLGIFTSGLGTPPC